MRNVDHNSVPFKLKSHQFTCVLTVSHFNGGRFIYDQLMQINACNKPFFKPY